jgi:hypothetical protein
LNDYIATMIGMVRDEVDFRELLYGDILYVGSASPGCRPTQTDNNNHYEALEQQGADLQSVLQQTRSPAVTGLPCTTQPPA